MRNILRFPENMSTQARTAFFSNVYFLGGDLVILGFAIFQALRIPAWQLNVLVGEAVVLLFTSIYALVLIRRNQYELGVWLAFVPFLLVLAGTSALISGLGFLLMIVSIAVVSLAGGPILPRQQAVALILTSIVMGVITLLVDLYIPTKRINIPGFQTVVIVLVSVMIPALGYTVYKQWQNYPLVAKMVIAFSMAALIPIIFVAYYTIVANTKHLTEDADTTLHSAALQTAATIDTFMANNLGLVKTASELHILREYLLLPVAERLGSETEAVLYNDLQAVARSNQTYIEAVGLMDQNGIDVADTAKGDIGTDKSKHIYVAEPLRTDELFSTALISPTTHNLSLYFSAPVHGEDGGIIGVLRIRYKGSVLQEMLLQAARNVGLPTGSVSLLDENHIFLAHSTQPQVILHSVAPFSADKFAQLQAEGHLPTEMTGDELSLNLVDLENGLKNFSNEPIFSAEVFDEEASVDQGVDEVAAVGMQAQPWLIVFAQPQSTFLAPATQQTRTYALLNIFIAMLVAIGAVIVAGTISYPLTRLTEVARQIAAGNRMLQAPVTSQDEIGMLAGTFNQMTTELNKSYENLEHRAKAISTVGEVSRLLSRATTPRQLVVDVVEQLHSAFHYYHAHIYYVDETTGDLIMAGGTGEVGATLLARGHKVLKGQGLVGQAAATNLPVLVDDVSKVEGWLPNPLLPDTKSEVAIPISSGDQVLGVLDVQQDVVYGLGQEDVDLLESLTGQIAISYRNARALEESLSKAKLETLVNTIGQKIQRSTSIEETLQIAVREIGEVLGASRVKAQIAGKTQN